MSTATKATLKGKLQQSTAVTVYFQAFQDDHQTPKLGITNGNWTVKALLKQGGAFDATITPVVTEDAYGWYEVPLTTTHTNTLGRMVLHFEAAGVDDVNIEFDVVNYDPTAAINVATISNNAITAAAIADGAIDAATFAANAITAAVIADGAIDAATFAANAITSTVIAASAIGASQLATGAITNAKFAAGAIDAAAIAADAIGASELATDAVAEIAAAVWAALTENLAYPIGLAVWNAAPDDAGLDTPSYGWLVRVLFGLSNGMVRIDNTTHTVDGLTVARLRVWEMGDATFDTATDGGTGEGEIAAINVTTSYDAPGKIGVYKAKLS
jgi:hypothetical protein